MKKLIFSLFLIGLTISSCKESKIQQGEIEYEISYPYSELSGIMDVMLPKKMTVKFKGDRMIASIEKGKIFRTDIISTTIKKHLMMRLDFGSEKLEADLNNDDLKSLATNQTQFENLGVIRKDTVAGLQATFYKVKSANDKVGEFETAFSNNLTIENTEWFTSYKDTKGIPLIYIIERYGVIMHVRAYKFKPREISDSEFETEKNFKSVSYKSYENKVNELFQLIIED
ncbi:hypothetical protein DNU06_07355 [Putridiphycobacter roseus]|uniref:DUF4292 domain-containing protein n=1 Tax=Putridiphycobacter roseus TaxID=2219161 RepID=A0A2W1NSI1_9FLAO|nr:hypothetical protein [Putridiphycobacter roseus]PZE17638.1 hypothetical protein DNU06_07355 [Putridiphycobacter roseus]